MHTLIVLATTEGADAAAQQPAAGNALTSLLPFLVLGLVFYFLIIRPQRKRQRKQQDLLRSVSLGDEIVTIGGFHGTVVALGDDTVELELSPGTVVTLSRQAIGKVLTEPPEVVLDDEEPLDDDELFDDEGIDHEALDDEPLLDDDQPPEDGDSRDRGR